MKTVERAGIGLLCFFCLSILAHSGFAVSSWEVRSADEGSALLVESGSTSFILIGTFEEGSFLSSSDGGFSWEPDGFEPDIPADRVRCLSLWGERSHALSLSGEIWVRSGSGGWWQRTSSPPDSLGIVRVIHDVGSDVWLGSNTGWLMRWLDGVGNWDPVARIDTTAIAHLALGATGYPVTLLEDGRLFASDSVWIEAPFRASRISFPIDGPTSTFGHAIDAESLHIWQTTDGGIAWTDISAGLTSPELARWAGQARSFYLGRNGLGLIACGDALLASDDGGMSWRIAATGTHMFLDVAVDDLDEIVTAGERIHRSTDWAFSLKQTFGGAFGSVEIGSIYTYWALDEGLLLSIDRGDSWWRQPLPENADRLQRIAARGDHEIWLHFDGPDGTSTYYSQDRGNNLEIQDIEGRLKGLRNWSFSDSGCSWACTDSTLLRGRENGREWTIVRENLPGIESMAARDSLHVALSTSESILVTMDGGSTWLEGPPPAGTDLRALTFSSDSLLIGVGAGVSLLEAKPPWTVLDAFDFGDTLLDVKVAENGSGWAVGNSGLLVGTVDGGRRWERYAVDLEISHLRSRLPHLSFLDASHAATGSGTTLLRFIPDGSGPIFRYGISVHPYLSRYLDIHITARERLQNDSLYVTIDGVKMDANQFDSVGFLYRVRYHIPPQPGEQIMVVHGRDWVGNERIGSIQLQTNQLGLGGTGSLTWDDTRIDLWGEPFATVAMLEGVVDDAKPPPPWIIAGRPFRIAVQGGASLLPGHPADRLGLWANGRWQLLEAGKVPVDSDAVFAVFRDGTKSQVEKPLQMPLRIYPIPARDRLTIRWNGRVHGRLSWEIIDVSGRRRAKGSLRRGAAEPVQIQHTDISGRPLPAGVYWFRIRDYEGGTSGKFLIAR